MKKKLLLLLCLVLTGIGQVMAIDAGTWKNNEGNDAANVPWGNLSGNTEYYKNGLFTGDALYQEISVENGIYEVKFKAVASNTGSRDGFIQKSGTGLSYVFANSVRKDISVELRDAVDSDVFNASEYTLTTTVTNGTLRFGITCNEEGGNWFVVNTPTITKITWPVDYPSTSLSNIGITTSSTGVELNANGGWYYMLNQSGYYATLSDSHTLVTSNTEACPVFFDTNTGWDKQVWLITTDGYVYMPGGDTWTTNTNGQGTEGYRFWKYALSNGKYKLNNQGLHKDATSGKNFLAPNNNAAGVTIFADKQDNTLWSLIPAYKVELIEKLNNTYNTYVNGNSSDKALALQSALEDIYCSLSNTSVTTKESNNIFAARINSALAIYDANLLIVNRDFEAATWNQGWNGTSNNNNDKNSKFVKKTGGINNVCAEMWNGSALTANDLNQTIKYLPAGLYSLSARAIAQNIDATLYAKIGETERAVTFRSEEASSQTVWFKLDETSDVQIGFKQNAGGSSGAKWIAVDDFSLQMQNELPSLTAVDGKMNGDVAQAQTNALATYNANKNLDTHDAAVAAIAAAQESVDHYATFGSALAAQKDVIDNTNLYTPEAFTTYNDNYTTLKGKYDNNTLTNDDVVVNPTIATGHHANPVDVANLIMSQWNETNYNWDSYHANTWSVEGNTDGSNFTVPFIEYWGADANSLGAKTISTKEIEVPNGLYSVTAWVRVRAKNNVNATDATGITLSVNEGTPTDVTEGTQLDETQFTLAEVSAEGLVREGNLVISFNVANDNNISWLAFKNVKYTKLRDLTPEEEIVYATDEEITAFNEAIETVETNMQNLGFADGEYAPYNNVEAIVALKAAKALDVENPIDIEILAPAKNALDNATWTPNDGEVNAVYDGTFANAEIDGAPAGWTMSNNTLGGGYHSRAFVGDVRLSEFGNVSNSAFFIRFDGTNSDRGSMYYYGKTEGYTMPLKSGTQYYLSIDVKNWGTATNKPFKVFVTNPSGNGVEEQQINTTSDADTNDDAPQNIAIIFTANEDGNYVINFQCPGSDDNKHNVVVSNIVLKKAVKQEFKITSAGWATLVTDLSKTTKPEAVTVYEVTAGAEDTDVTLSEVDNIEPNKPYLISGESSTYSIYGYPVAKDATPTNGLLVGNWNAGATITGDGTQYLLQKHDSRVAFYLLANDATAKLAANSAYLKKETASPVKAFYFDGLGDETAISALEALTSGNAKIYNINGRQQQKLQKGVNIVNGKKIIVK